MSQANANEMTFGVEIECYLPADVRVNMGGYHAGRQVEQLPAGWNAQRDGSLNSAPAGHYGVEIVSPVLKGAEGIKQVKAVCDWLNSIGAKVNRSTGLHVHVGFGWGLKELRRLAHYVAQFEKAFYAATGTRSREQGSYCKPVKESYQFKAAFKDGQATTAHDLPGDRYHLLNVTNLIWGDKKTVEFRCFAGTTNATKIVGYVWMALGVVQKAVSVTRQPAWDAKADPATTATHQRGGVGQTELGRLFYGLGWTKGREKRVFGTVEAEGCPSLVEVKAELMRLAKKYDGGAAG